MLGKKIFFLIVGVSSIAAIFTPPADAQVIKNLFGIVSTSDHLARLRTLREMETTLAEIKNTNADILSAQKQIAKISAAQIDILKNKMEQAQNKLTKLTAEVEKNTKIKIAELTERIQRREGKIEDLEKALAEENKVAKASAFVNNITNGAIASINNFVQKYDENSKNEAENKILALKESVNQLKGEISKERQSTQSTFSSPKYQDQYSMIANEMKGAEDGLANFTAVVNELKQKMIFTPYNPKADSLLNTLKKQIAEAKCPSITDISKTNQSNIDECKRTELQQAGKSMSIANSCKNITINSFPVEITNCITEYRQKR